MDETDGKKRGKKWSSFKFKPESMKKRENAGTNRLQSCCTKFFFWLAWNSLTSFSCLSFLLVLPLVLCYLFKLFNIFSSSSPNLPLFRTWLKHFPHLPASGDQHPLWQNVRPTERRPQPWPPPDGRAACSIDALAPSPRSAAKIERERERERARERARDNEREKREERREKREERRRRRRRRAIKTRINVKEATQQKK